jgi:hypothetical protein
VQSIAINQYHRRFAWQARGGLISAGLIKKRPESRFGVRWRSRGTYLAGAASLPVLAPGVVSDLEAFLSFFFLSFFLVVPLAPLLSLVPPAADAPDVSLPPEALAPLLLLSDGVAPMLLVPEEPDAPPALLLSVPLEPLLAPGLLVPDAPDAPPALLLSAPLELLLAPGLLVPDAPDEEVSLAPDEVPLELDGLDGLPACAD